MKRFRSILLTVILTLALCFSVVACNGAGATKYTLSFEMNGHGTAIEAVKYGVDEETAEPDSPSESGWRFDGWYEDEELYFPFYFGDTIDEDTTVYAKWTQVFEVAFNTGVSDFTLETQQVEAGGLVNLPASDSIKSAGKKFEGWYADAGFNIPFNAQTTPITRDLTIYAKWSTYFLVTFDRNERGSAARTPKPQEYKAEGSKAVRPDDMSANSFKFLGWSVSKDGSAGLYDFDTVLTDSITLYAQWVRLYAVNFNLNNEEALQQEPERQTVADGEFAVRPEVDPVVSGYVFNGWFTQPEGGEEFKFDSMPIKSITTVYAQWNEDKVGTLDVGPLPEYSHRNEAAFGERPDLDGYVIDGKMGEAEKWENQKWYKNAITDAPTVQMKITTQFSEKGLYWFISVEDNGGLYMDGQNYYFKNSNVLFRITDGTVTNEYRMDTLTLFPSYNTVKIAVNIAEGEVNTANTENKRAVMNIEAFATWEDLHFSSDLSSVKIFAVYNYKRIASDNIKYSLYAPFVNSASISIADYVEYNGTGYVNADADEAVLGTSSYNIAKTNGWDISHESDENDAYVSSNGASTQAIFYKNVVDTDYYKFAFEIDASKVGGIGKAGAIIYNSSTNYAMIVFDVDEETYDYTEKKFKKAKPYLVTTDKNGKMNIRALAEFANLDNGKLDVEIVFSNGYIYCILNDVLIHCEFITSLNVRTNPGLCTLSGGANLRFKNYTAQVLTLDEARVETAKYAYVISKGRLNNLTIDLSTTAVSSKEGESKTVVMEFKNSPVTITTTQKERIMNDGVIDEGIRVYRIDKVIFTVNDEAKDATADIDAGLRYGTLVYEYPFKGDSVITNTSVLVPTEELTAIIGRVVDSHTGDGVSGTVTILSDNPRLSNYDMTIVDGNLVLVVPKGYNYRLVISQAGYRNSVVEIDEQVNDVYRFAQPIKLTPNILGGTAVSKKTGATYISNLTGWDMTNETNGEIIYETEGGGPWPVYFSGYTVSKYQYVKLSVSNITDTIAHPTYEKDPSIGFMFDTPTRRAYIGLRAQGLRFREHLDYWNPNDVNIYGKNTCNHIDVSGSHIDTLEVIRIQRNLYAYINGEYMGNYVIAEEFEDECAIAVSGTIAYYGKIMYRDYEIKVDDEALAIAMEKVGINYSIADSIYGYDDLYQTDYTKPLVKVEAVEVEYDDGSKDSILLEGSELTVSLTEHASENEIYNVSIGSLGNVVLSAQSPTATFIMPAVKSGTVNISLVRDKAAIITGKYVSSVDYKGPFTGYALLENGAKLAFTSGEDGSFAVMVPTSTVFTIKIDNPGYIAPDCTSRAPSAAGREKDIGEIPVYLPTLGGKIPGVDNFTSAISGYTVFYDANPDTIYEGEAVEVHAVGSHYVAINRGTFEDFDISFSFVRYQYSDRPNETDPCVGLLIVGPNGYDSMMFHTDGVRNTPMGAGWEGRTEVKGIMKYDTRSSFGVKVDFRFVRRGSTYLQYYKLENDADWNLIHVQSGKVTGSAGIFLGTGNTTNSHYVMWNVVSTVPSAETLESLVAPISVNITSGESSGTVTVTGGTEINGVVKQVIGDTLVLEFKPASGNVLANVKVNGKRVDVTNDKMSLLISETGVTVDVMFEPEFETRVVTGKIALPSYNSKLTLPSSINLIAFLEDGRQYEFKNVAVAGDGSVSFMLRDGKFKITAYNDTLSSTPKEFTVSDTSTDFGTITLDVMRVGDVTVNGINVKSEAVANEDLLFTHGMTLMPIRKAPTLWLSEGVVKGDFIAQTTMIQSKDPSDPWYTTDEVVGFQLTNGTSTLAIMFVSSGFRVHAKGYSPTEESNPMRNSGGHYFGNKVNADTDTINTLGLKRVGKDLIVYANGEKFMTINSTDGIVLHISGYMQNDAESKRAHVKSCAAALLDNVNQEIAIGYRCNINMGNTAVYFNQTGFYNTIVSDDADVVSSYNGNMSK